MRAFADLYQRLDESTATRDKVAAMVSYFASAAPADAAWAVHALTGGKLKRLVRSTDLRLWLSEHSGYPPWLIDETYAHVGDLAETISLLASDSAPMPDSDVVGLGAWIEQRLLPLSGQPPEAQGVQVRAWWAQLPRGDCLVLNKLLTGSLRVGVSQRLLIQALTQMTALPGAELAHRLSGGFKPTPAAWQALIHPEPALRALDQPYPFFLASALEHLPEALGGCGDWLAEWKWDGIRAQLLLRDGELCLWSRGEERLDGRFPEIEAAARQLGRGVVLDGEILGWRDGSPLPFAALQKRIGRLKPGPRTLAECPVRFIAYDLLEMDGVDLREQPLAERRTRLEALLAATGESSLMLSPRVPADDWTALAEQRSEARTRGVEGLMLKRLASPYQVGRRRGDWWKWKIDPLSVDAVLIYAQAGHGRRSNLYTDYTFALWDQGQLVPVAKAYSGLNDQEIARLDRWIRAHTLERFGPVRSVQAEQVFELAFEGVNASSRHKSGVAVRFPRIARWRNDKGPDQADTLDALRALAR